jgi:hypothetical protein
MINFILKIKKKILFFYFEEHFVQINSDSQAKHPSGHFLQIILLRDFESSK